LRVHLKKKLLTQLNLTSFEFWKVSFIVGGCHVLKFKVFNKFYSREKFFALDFIKIKKYKSIKYAKKNHTHKTTNPIIDDIVPITVWTLGPHV